MRMVSLIDGTMRRGDREFIARDITRGDGFTMARIDIVDAGEFRATVQIERKIGQKAMSAKELKKRANSAIEAMEEREAINAPQDAGAAGLHF